MISITNVTTEKNFDKPIHSYILRINKEVITRFRHTRSEPLSVILRKASKAAEKQEQEELLSMVESFSTNKTEVGSLSSFKKGNADSYKNNHINFKKAHKNRKDKESKEAK